MIIDINKNMLFTFFIKKKSIITLFIYLFDCSNKLTIIRACTLFFFFFFKYILMPSDLFAVYRFRGRPRTGIYNTLLPDIRTIIFFIFFFPRIQGPERY